ncbi:MAG: hypothetical protein ABL962_18965, partial [Fimbriimonadaceae bacterium]
WCIVSVAIVASAFGFGVLPYSSAQDAAKVEKSGEEKVIKKVSGDRLPANYGKIGLSDEQRKKVYEIVNRFGSQINELENKVAELKKSEVAECEAVLNPNQRQSLQDLKAEAKKKAASKKKDSAKEEANKEKAAK